MGSRCETGPLGPWWWPYIEISGLLVRAEPTHAKRALLASSIVLQFLSQCKSRLTRPWIRFVLRYSDAKDPFWIVSYIFLMRVLVKFPLQPKWLLRFLGQKWNTIHQHLVHFETGKLSKEKVHFAGRKNNFFPCRVVPLKTIFPSQTKERKLGGKAVLLKSRWLGFFCQQRGMHILGKKASSLFRSPLIKW